MNSDERFPLILLYLVIGIVVLGAMLHHCKVTADCEQKHCEHGSPMVVRDQGEITGFSQCICVERPR